MTELVFNVSRRTAELQNFDEVPSKVRELMSYQSPGFMWSPMYKKFVFDPKTGGTKRVWDGRIHMITKNGVVSVGLLRGILEELKEANFSIKINEWRHRPSVALKAGFTEKNTKYDYQNKCVEAMLNCLKWGGGVVLSATGSGKTKMAAQFFSHLNCPALFIVDQRNLMYQSQGEIAEWLGERVGVVGDSRFEPQRVTVATIQTLGKFQKNPHFKVWLQSVDVMLVDELHVQMGRRNFKLIEGIKPKAVIGLTATLQMGKAQTRLRTFALCGPVVFRYPADQAIREGVLERAAVVQCHVPSPSITGNGNDYVSDVVENPHINQFVKELVTLALKQNKRVVVLVERIRHIEVLHELLPSAHLAYGKIALGDRQQSMAEFEQGDAKLILANVVFKKGINLKRVDMVVDCAQRANPDDALQKIGRAVRLHTAKNGSLYFDIVTGGNGTSKQPPTKLERGGATRRGALKRSGYPVAQLKGTQCTPEQALQTGQEMLKVPEQRELFP